MKNITRFFCALISAMLLSSLAAAETIKTYCGTLVYKPGYLEFQTEHPDVSCAWAEQVYDSPSQFTSALVTRECDCDLYTWSTHSADWSILMEKGFCVDLSDSEVLMANVSRMHPQIVKQAMHDGRLYAWPDSIGFVYLQIAEDVWLEAGFTQEDVPQSFPEFLDFLERWCDRIEEEPEANIRVFTGWDASSYTSAVYTAWLARLLLDQAMMQQQYAGESLRFNSPELLSLLERCDTIGRRLYQLETRKETYALFENSLCNAWPERPYQIVCLRLNDAQPKLIESHLDMWAIYPGSEHTELCIEMLEKVAAGPCDGSSPSPLYLYQDAQPMYIDTYETDLAEYTGKLSDVQAKLAQEDLSADARAELEDKEAQYLRRLEFIEEHKWLVKPEQLADYQASADGLFFPGPNVLTHGKGAGTLENLCNLFGSRAIAAQQLLQELDRMTRMLELEGE